MERDGAQKSVSRTSVALTVSEQKEDRSDDPESPVREALVDTIRPFPAPADTFDSRG